MCHSFSNYRKIRGELLSKLACSNKGLLVHTPWLAFVKVYNRVSWAFMCSFCLFLISRKEISRSCRKTCRKNVRGLQNENDVVLREICSILWNNCPVFMLISAISKKPLEENKVGSQILFSTFLLSEFILFDNWLDPSFQLAQSISDCATQREYDAI